MTFKDPEIRREWHRKWHHIRRQRVLDYLGGKCVRCGTTESLEIDHIDRAQKSFPVSQALSLTEHGRSELDKCQLLCKKHHLEKTRSEAPGWSHGTRNGWKIHHCACEACDVFRVAWNEKRRAERAARRQEK